MRQKQRKRCLVHDKAPSSYENDKVSAEKARSDYEHFSENLEKCEENNMVALIAKVGFVTCKLKIYNFTGETASTSKTITEESQYFSYHFLNCDEIGLFWKMRDCTCIGFIISRKSASQLHLTAER